MTNARNASNIATTQPLGFFAFCRTSAQYPIVFAERAHSFEQCFCLSCFGSNCVSQIGHILKLFIYQTYLTPCVLFSPFSGFRLIPNIALATFSGVSGIENRPVSRFDERFVFCFSFVSFIADLLSNQVRGRVLPPPFPLRTVSNLRR